MNGRALLLSFCLAGAAAAEGTDETAPEPAPAEKPEAPAPAPEKSEEAPKPKAKAAPAAPAAQPGEPAAPQMMQPMSLGAEKDAELARGAARRFFVDLLAGDARELVSADCGLPFYVEDRKYTAGEELLQEWLKNLREKRTDLLTLYGIDLYTPTEMEKKYGSPPKRLANIPWRSAHTFVAVANLSGHAGVALVQLGPRGWRVVGYHD